MTQILKLFNYFKVKKQQQN